MVNRDVRVVDDMLNLTAIEGITSLLVPVSIFVQSVSDIYSVRYQ